MVIVLKFGIFFDANVYFEDVNKSKKRPVLIVDEINNICLSLKITKNTERKGIDEYTIINWKEAGLDLESNIRLSKLYPLNEKFLENKRGSLQLEDRKLMINKMNEFLKVNNARYTHSLVDKLKKDINKNL